MKQLFFFNVCQVRRPGGENLSQNFHELQAQKRFHGVGGHLPQVSHQRCYHFRPHQFTFGVGVLKMGGQQRGPGGWLPAWGEGKGDEDTARLPPADAILRTCVSVNVLGYYVNKCTNVPVERYCVLVP